MRPRVMAGIVAMGVAAGLLIGTQSGPWLKPRARPMRWRPSEPTHTGRRRNAWGQPDLEGIWTTDDMRGVPMSRPERFGNRLYLTDEEFAERARQRSNARDVDNARTGTFRNEEGSRDFSYTSMVIDPPDGRVPALTSAARARPRLQGSFGTGPWEKVQDFSLYDRCITRGAIGSFMPAVYGNGARILQTPDSVVISQIYEYGCHEGNNAMRNALTAERAFEKAAADAAAKGLPPPERVFERVNGPDRAR